MKYVLSPETTNVLVLTFSTNCSPHMHLAIMLDYFAKYSKLSNKSKLIIFKIKIICHYDVIVRSLCAAVVL